MKKISITIALFLAAFMGFTQQVDWEKIHALQPDIILQSGSRKPTQVLLLGTFHFAYPNLDKHITDSSKHIDVLSAKRQQEIQELADVIKRFKPTRIYIESQRQGFHDSLYNEYRNNRFRIDRNEIYQVAYRVSRELNLPAVYAADASSFASDNDSRFPWIDSMWNSNQQVDPVRDQYWDNLYSRLYTVGDSVDQALTILENFLLMAEPSTLNRMQGAYMSAGINTKNNDGPDMIAMWWFSRNLRIFNNILKTRPTHEDRIVVLFGNAHIPTLKHCFLASPEFEVVELKSLLK